MNPIRQGDGTGLSVPGFSEVRKGDGTVLWSATGVQIPGSAVGHYVAEDYDPGTGTWPDRSGAGNDLTAVGSPKKEVAGWYGTPSVYLDGLDDAFNAENPQYSRPNTVIVVADMMFPVEFGGGGPRGDFSPLIDSRDGSTLEDRNAILFRHNNANYDWVARGDFNKNISGSSNLDTQLFSAVFRTTADSLLREDETQTATGANGTSDMGRFRVGGDDPDFGNYGEYRVKEILICNDDLDATGELTTQEQRLVTNQDALNQTQTFVQTEELTDVNAHQGVASDGTNLYTSGSRSPNKELRKIDKSGNTVDSLANPENEGTAVDQVNGLHYRADENYIYGGALNETTGESYIKVFDASDLSYVTEHSVKDQHTEGGVWHAPGSRTNESWWVWYGQADELTEYDSNFNEIAAYTVDYPIDDPQLRYQGGWFEGDYIYLNLHNTQISQYYCDVYKWNGTGFDYASRLTRPTSNVTQGIHKEPGEDVMWFAERNTGTDTHDVIKATFNHTNGRPDGA